MSTPGSLMLRIARSGGRVVWVRVESVRGSAPREPGASMLVDAQGRRQGTIGGGHLEFEAIARARRMLAGGPRARLERFALGPGLGQCCGGSVGLSLRCVDAGELPWVEPLAALDSHGGTLWLDTALDGAAVPHSTVRAARPDDAPSAGATRDAPAPARLVSRLDVHPWHVWVFGAGHVGEALVRVLATLPARIVWVDPRGAQFPADAPAGVECRDADSPAHEVHAIPAGADVLVMTHSHALDFDVCAALLARTDLGLCGVIGSATKAARFRARLARRGLPAEAVARLQCPIGAPPAGGARAPLDRHPGAIAVSVAFALWERRRTAHPAGAVGAGVRDD
jgi:xanthine dehydrogenase accessory factor